MMTSSRRAAGSTAPTTTTRARPDRDHAELGGGPLDSLLLDITGWTADEIQTGIALTTGLVQGLAPAARPCATRPR
ncbi:hypothetical protein [Streptomyces sp. NPDC057545]|uniref:hypothetical protein n=1 Tax=Streptomyces sp. NPDC057545 TaxID=3346164 RepID=UPI0036CD854D